MKICSLLSGSSGNCVYVESRESRILIDAGGSGRQLEASMKEAGINPRQLDAILVTHEHIDHIKGLGVLSRRYRLPIYANAGTWEAMLRKLGKLDRGCIREFKSSQPFPLRDLLVQPIPIHHDAREPVGYALYSGDDKLSVVTDTGFVDEKIVDAMAGSQVYYFEANHDVEMLMEGPYPLPLKQRILSEKGHLSNRQSGQALAEVLQGQQEGVILAHMSINNNEEGLCRMTVDALLAGEGLDPFENEQLLVAPRYQPSPFFDTELIRKKQEAGGGWK